MSLKCFGSITKTGTNFRRRNIFARGSRPGRFLSGRFFDPGRRETEVSGRFIRALQTNKGDVANAIKKVYGIEANMMARQFLATLAQKKVRAFNCKAATIGRVECILTENNLTSRLDGYDCFLSTL